LASLLLRDANAIEQLNRTIQSNNDQIRDLYNNSLADNTEVIQRLMDLSAEDIEVRDRYQHSADLLTALYEGNVPPSATTHIDHSDSSSDSDPDDNPPSTGQGLNIGNNESDENNERNSEVDQSNDNQESKQSSDNNQSNVNSDKNLTDDVLDISDTLHMFFDEYPEKNKSTIDFVLQKQQEEMPDIMDSDGSE
jgi:hypothetical protein